MHIVWHVSYLSDSEPLNKYRKQTVPKGSGGAADCGIRIHHIVAASDDFNRISMHWDLMPAARANYMHEFRGYFNCISQVIYFHDPDYQRRPQVCIGCYYLVVVA